MIEEFDWLKEEIVHRRHDLGFMGRTEDVVEHACDMMNDLIDRKNEQTGKQKLDRLKQ